MDEFLGKVDNQELIMASNQANVHHQFISYPILNQIS